MAVAAGQIYYTSVLLSETLFAALTTIFAKLGMQDISSTLGTAVRTVVVLVLAWLIVFFFVLFTFIVLWLFIFLFLLLRGVFVMNAVLSQPVCVR